MANRHEDDDEHLTSRRRATSPSRQSTPNSTDAYGTRTSLCSCPSRSSASVDTVRHTKCCRSAGASCRTVGVFYESTSHSWAQRAGGNGMERKKRRLPPSTRRLERGRMTLDSTRRTGRQAGRRSSTKRRPEPSLICARRTATGPTRERALGVRTVHAAEQDPAFPVGRRPRANRAHRPHLASHSNPSASRESVKTRAAASAVVRSYRKVRKAMTAPTATAIAQKSTNITRPTHSGSRRQPSPRSRPTRRRSETQHPALAREGSLLPKMRQISFRRQTRSGGGPHGDRLLGFNEIGLGDRLRPLREKPAAAQNVGSRLVR